MYTQRAIVPQRVVSGVRVPALLAGCAALLVLSAAFTAAVSASEPSRPTRPRGCESLEAALVHLPDPSSRIALADCYAGLGRTASAWSQYREAASAAHDVQAPELETLARARAKALEPELSYVTVSTWKGQDVRVTQDGAPIHQSVLGTAVPLDPGAHVIRATAPGKRSWSKTIELGSHGDHVTVSVPVLPDDVQLLTRELRAPGEQPLPLGASLPAETDRAGSLQRTLGIVAGAIGIAGIATGTLFGVKAASDWGDAKAMCQPYPYCGEDGAQLAQDAKTSALISTLGFATGIVGLSGGALLYFTAETREPKAPAITVGVGRVQVQSPF